MGINDLMMHKKNIHKKELCSKFQTGKCTKNPCWYTHEYMAQTTAPAAPPPTKDFWQVQPIPVPPTLNQQQMTQSRPYSAKDPMIVQMMEMMKQQQRQITQMNQALQALASMESTETI